MGFTDQPDIDIDEIDHVSAWIMFGVTVLGAVLATLDWFQLLPSTPPAAAQVHAQTHS